MDVHFLEVLLSIFFIFRLNQATSGVCEVQLINNTREGIITSPNFPFPYPEEFCKNWYISGSEKDVITISFIWYDIGPPTSSPLCDHDHLLLGPSGRVLCNKQDVKSPPFVFIRKRHVVISFESRTRVLGYKPQGFSLKYIISDPLENFSCDKFQCDNNKCIYKEWRCNGADECGDGSDELGCFPGPVRYPQPPVSPENCENGFICLYRITMTYQCLPNYRRCNDVEDCVGGQDENQTFCNNYAPSCSHVYNGLRGYLTSPGYPNNYPSNAICQYFITAPKADGKVQLRFVSFALENKENTDYLEVYSDVVSNRTLLGRYYGDSGLTQLPSMIESPGNKMIVIFRSNSKSSFQGFNMTYQQKGYCLSDQLSCGPLEEDCYPSGLRCDGIMDCAVHGADEKGCHDCPSDHFYCSSQCYTESQRCNGVTYCNNGGDELNCNSELCGSNFGTFLCKNTKCIYETWTCDKTDDCGDNSDEENCPRVTNLIRIAAVTGALVCSLLLVVAVGCTCKLYNLRAHHHHGHRHETPLTQLYIDYMRHRAPPPYHEAMLNSRPYDEVQQEMRERAQQEFLSRRRHRRRHRSQSNHHPPIPEVDEARHNLGPCDEATIELIHNDSAPTRESLACQVSERDLSSDLDNILTHGSTSSRLALLSDHSSDSESSVSADLLGSGENDSLIQMRVTDSSDIHVLARWSRERSKSPDEEMEELFSDVPGGSISSDHSQNPLLPVDGASVAASCDSVEGEISSEKPNSPHSLDTEFEPLQ